MTANGARVRITEREINETILLDRRIAIVAGDRVGDVRGYTVVSSPALVQGIRSLYEAAWHDATDLASYQARFTELGAREILELQTTSRRACRNFAVITRSPCRNGQVRV